MYGTTAGIPLQNGDPALKQFQLSNHLGNVLAVVNGERKAIPDNTGNAIDHFEAQLENSSDYYPFGSLLRERSTRWVWKKGPNFSTNPADIFLALVNMNEDPTTIAIDGKSYRFSFNGKEKDNEVNGEGNQIDYGARIQDTRLGRFLSVDPKAKSYPMLSSYQFASNTPIQAIDLDGMEAIIVHGTSQTQTGVHITPEAKKELLRISGNTKINDGFRWNAPLSNNSFTRNISANQLVKYIVKARMAMMKNGEITEDEAISLIGYSHGGNVAIHAARKLGKKGIRVNLITLSTPAYNTNGNDAYGGGLDSEDPRSSKKGINAHIQIIAEKDDVVNIANGEETYNNGQTKNYVIPNEQMPYNNGIEAHTKFPNDKKLDDALKNIPAMPKAPAPDIKPIENSKN